MLSISPSIAGTVVCAFLVAVVPIATNGAGIMDAIPPSIMNAIPSNCTGNEDAEFELAIDCAAGMIIDSKCFGLIPLIGEFGNIPSASEIETCEDINDPFCTFATACEPCAAAFEALVTCVVLTTEDIDQNTTDFIDSCSLACDVDGVEGTASNDGIIDNMLAPVT
mmetsp:Transcript_43638/g.44321  ORF Transcript_43638/g.44321 Transcript_43638/m.44321 type:complete len:166 (-) Transcript_43638:682-1179(-)